MRFYVFIRGFYVPLKKIPAMFIAMSFDVEVEVSHTKKYESTSSVAPTIPTA